MVGKWKFGWCPLALPIVLGRSRRLITNSIRGIVVVAANPRHFLKAVHRMLFCPVPDLISVLLPSNAKMFLSEKAEDKGAFHLCCKTNKYSEAMTETRKTTFPTEMAKPFNHTK